MVVSIPTPADQRPNGAWGYGAHPDFSGMPAAPAAPPASPPIGTNPQFSAVAIAPRSASRFRWGAAVAVLIVMLGVAGVTSFGWLNAHNQVVTANQTASSLRAESAAKDATITDLRGQLTQAHVQLGHLASVVQDAQTCIGTMAQSFIDAADGHLILASSELAAVKGACNRALNANTVTQ